MEEEKRKEVRHIMISYIPYGDLEYEVKDYENIINYIANYFKEKDYQYVIAREPIINEKLKEDVIPISVIQNKIEELRIKQIEFENDNANRFLIKEFTRKYTEKNDHDYGMFNIMEAISYMTNNEYIARKHVLQELLEERNK